MSDGNAREVAHTNPWHLNILYGSIADALPQEGRDYTVSLGTDEHGNVKSVRLDGITPLGDAWIPHAMRMLREKIDGIKSRRS